MVRGNQENKVLQLSTSRAHIKSQRLGQQVQVLPDSVLHPLYTEPSSRVLMGFLSGSFILCLLFGSFSSVCFIKIHYVS